MTKNNLTVVNPTEIIFIPGAVAVKYLITEFDSNFFEISFWLRDHFTTYDDSFNELSAVKDGMDAYGPNYNPNRYNPVHFCYNRWEFTNFKPSDADRFIDYNNAISDSSTPFGSYGRIEAQEIIDYMVEKGTLKYLTVLDIDVRRLKDGAKAENARQYFRKADLQEIVNEHGRYLDLLKQDKFGIS